MARLHAARALHLTDVMRAAMFTSLVLAACSPNIIASTPRSVTLNRVHESSIGEATDLAQQHCAQYGRQAEQSTSLDARDAATSYELSGGTVSFRCVDDVVPVVPVNTPAAPPAPAAPTADARKTVVGNRSLYCAPTAPDVGLCFLQEDACHAESARSGAACETRTAGSCMNATKILDGTKLTICAVSISDCEARRRDYEVNPDYEVTRCGIYRSGPEV